MTRLENFVVKGFFAHAIVSLVKLDKGCSFTLLGTHSCAIGDSLLCHWGLTLSLLGIHSCAIGDSLLRYWGLSLVNPQWRNSIFPPFLLSSVDLYFKELRREGAFSYDYPQLSDAISEKD